MEAKHNGSDTMLSQIIKAVEGKHTTSKARYSTYCRYRSSISLYPSLLVFVVLTGLVWYFIVGDSINVALINATAVMVIVCPWCASWSHTNIYHGGSVLGAEHGVPSRVRIS